MINTNFKTNYASKLFGNSLKTTTDTSISKAELKQLNKMEDKFISDAKTSYEENTDTVDLDNNTENDPYTGLTEEDAEILKEMRLDYKNGIRQAKQEVFDKEFEKANNEHNNELAKIKAKCDQIARVIGSGKNYSKTDARYLGNNNPTQLASALLNRSLAELMQEKDDEKAKKLTKKDDKNYSDLEAPKLEIASDELSTRELKGMPTAMDLPNYDSDYAGNIPITPPSAVISNTTYSNSGNSIAVSTSTPSSVDISM